MHPNDAQLAELLSLTSRSLAQLSEALTSFSLEMLASQDPAVRIASRRMLSRVALIQSAASLPPQLAGTPGETDLSSIGAGETRKTSGG